MWQNWSQAFSFKTKEASSSYCPLTTKESWSSFGLLKSGTQKGDIVFSDENIVTVEAKLNPQNNIVLTRHSEDVPKDILFLPEVSKCHGVKNWKSCMNPTLSTTVILLEWKFYEIFKSSSTSILNSCFIFYATCILFKSVLYLYNTTLFLSLWLQGWC